ncbi:hypothetical protein AQUCO_02600224v1 [Aquilegia coerulea]|uniref:F-box domain-containing protein n=1 Tax=Aquilegia coerulea TaxID=218851 RepID=A0A2G5D7Y3_AQUCA|nr:hypothetical protein AQUCO_02600224v1 [Aquilegia coerulea]
MEDKKKKKDEGSILPDEMILFILLLLPIKSLMRFRCVNKTWLQLLTNDSHFAQLYLNQLIKNNNLSLLALRKQEQTLVLHDETTLATIYSAVELRSSLVSSAIPLEVPFRSTTTNSNSNSSYYVYGICNGLVLVGLPKEKKKLFIWNPFTNDYIHIPYPPIPYHGFDSELCSDKGTNYLGFGFINNRYKVIRFCDCYSLPPYVGSNKHVSVYTLGVDSTWRNLEEIVYDDILTDCIPPLVNGALHWNASTDSNSDSETILSFDLKDEVFYEIPYPEYAGLNDQEIMYFNRIGELGGLLCMLGAAHSRENVEIWVMQQYGVANSWIKTFTIGRPEVRVSFTSCLRPVGVTQNREILLNDTGTGELILYNLETSSVINLRRQFGHHFYNAYTYTPCFISPRAITGGRHIM